jgi:hypothetical protein
MRGQTAGGRRRIPEGQPSITAVKVKDVEMEATVEKVERPKLGGCSGVRYIRSDSKLWEQKVMCTVVVVIAVKV